MQAPRAGQLCRAHDAENRLDYQVRLFKLHHVAGVGCHRMGC